MQLWLIAAVLVLCPLFLGSVELSWITVWSIMLSIGVLFGLATPLQGGQSRALACFLALCAIYALVTAVQFAPDVLSDWNDPVWRRVNDLLAIGVSGRISARGDIPFISFGHTLLFATAFLNGFCIGTSRRNSSALLWFARYAVLFYAIYGLFALSLTPGLLLWLPKHAYLDRLTATFVNPNTAATYMGAGAILWLCHAVAQLSTTNLSSIRVLLSDDTSVSSLFKLTARLAATVVCFAALLLTGSRGGLVCTCAGLLTASLFVLIVRARRISPRSIVLGGLALAAACSIVFRFSRVASGGLFDEGRWSIYVFCLEAIKQRPLFGAGLGTFPDLLPSLRTLDFNSWGVWDRAHSTLLEIGVEMGIPVLAAIVVAALASLVTVMRAAVQARNSGRHEAAAIAGIATLTYLHAMIDFSLQVPGYLIFFAILLGCGVSRACAPMSSSADSGTAGLATTRGAAGPSPASG